MSSITRIQAHLERAVLAAALALPGPAQRLLAGRVVVLDGHTLSVETQLMLALQRLAKVPAVETLPLDAARRELRRQAQLVGGAQPIGAVRDIRVPGAVGDLPARLYAPAEARPTDVRPMLVFLHGGGFIYGDLDSHDAPCRLLAERAGVRVLSVAYRLAPEAPFPAAYDDAVAAYRFVVEHAAEFGADPDRLAVGGDSAGGNLAAGVAIEAARAGLPLALQLLVYPATDADHPTRSAELFGEGFYLTTEFMDLANHHYFGESDQSDPRASPSRADLTELPAAPAPAIVVTAGFDPLRDEGEAYAVQLREAGTQVETLRAPSQIHGFLNMVGVGRRARGHVEEMADAVRLALR